jgi:hypothetical protein
MSRLPVGRRPLSVFHTCKSVVNITPAQVAHKGSELTKSNPQDFVPWCLRESPAPFCTLSNFTSSPPKTGHLRPEVRVERAVVDGFGEMSFLDGFSAFDVGDGS